MDNIFDKATEVAQKKRGRKPKPAIELEAPASAANSINHTFPINTSSAPAPAEKTVTEELIDDLEINIKQVLRALKKSNFHECSAKELAHITRLLAASRDSLKPKSFEVSSIDGATQMINALTALAREIRPVKGRKASKINAIDITPAKSKPPTIALQADEDDDLDADLDGLEASGLR